MRGQQNLVARFRSMWSPVVGPPSRDLLRCPILSLLPGPISRFGRTLLLQPSLVDDLDPRVIERQSLLCTRSFCSLGIWTTNLEPSSLDKSTIKGKDRPPFDSRSFQGTCTKKN